MVPTAQHNELPSASPRWLIGDALLVGGDMSGYTVIWKAWLWTTLATCLERNTLLTH